MSAIPPNNDKIVLLVAGAIFYYKLRKHRRAERRDAFATSWLQSNIKLKTGCGQTRFESRAVVCFKMGPPDMMETTVYISSPMDFGTRFKNWWKRLRLKSALQHFGLLITLMGYTVAGGLVRIVSIFSYNIYMF